MIGQTTKYVGTFETGEDSYVYVEEHAAPALTAMTAAPTGSATHRVEFGPFDAATAQQTYSALCQKYPIGMSTPMLASLDTALL